MRDAMTCPACRAEFEPIFVGVESMDDGGLSWLVGPFFKDEDAEGWREWWIESQGHDPEFIWVVRPTSTANMREYFAEAPDKDNAV